MKENYSKTLIISPSGNFYGSEQVLYNFLCNTNKNYCVYVPESSLFKEKLEALKKHQIKGFQSIKKLYFKIAFLFATKKYTTLYINEGGHIKYAKLIAQLFFMNKVIVHLRLVEDCDEDRIGKLPKNLKLISISNYISSLLSNYQHVQIYDPIDTKNIRRQTKTQTNASKSISIIGRISTSKGIDNYEQFFRFIQNTKPDLPVLFHFFGDVVNSEPKAVTFYQSFNNYSTPKIKFSGFVKNQELIYASTAIVLHLNPNEPLGRIGLESWAREIPFICFNKGGAGEINKIVGALNYTVNYTKGWEQELLQLIENVLFHKNENALKAINKQLKVHFDVDKYVKALEAQF